MKSKTEEELKTEKIAKKLLEDIAFKEWRDSLPRLFATIHGETEEGWDSHVDGTDDWRPSKTP